MNKSVGLTSSGLPTNLEHSFSRVPAVTHPRSTFDRSCTKKMTLDPNFLVPVYTDQVYPGDTIQVKANLFGRFLSALKFPIMDNLYIDWFAFFVPYRLLWTNFVHMMGEQANPGDPIPTAYTVPVVTPPAGTGWLLHSLGDYFGHIGAVLGQVSRSPSAYKYRAYNKIYFDWFRDQNFFNSPAIDVGNGPDAATDYPLRIRRKRHDMFTAMLPFAQKWSPVNVPLNGPFPVVFPSGIGAGPSFLDGLYDVTQNKIVGPMIGGPLTGSDLNATSPSVGVPASGDVIGVYGPGPTDAYADPSSSNTFTINAMRLAITTQQLFEIDMRSGTRFIESNLAHFGVTSPDARLQRSEYLGGGTVPFMVHPIAQTSETATTPQGTLAAFSTLSGNVNFSQSFTEHGVVMVIAEVRADQTYWQGIEHSDIAEHGRYDMYFPVFANIGEQPYLSQEIYCDGTSGDLNVFGYQEPFAHLRYKPSTIGGYFRPDASGSLDFMHLSIDYGSRPLLNGSFLNEQMPISRVVAVNATPFFILDSWWANRSTRVLPTFGVPGLNRL